MASAAQFIERNLEELCLQAISNMISRDKSRLGRDKSGPYEFCIGVISRDKSVPTTRRDTL
jgi:hypothetical protein